MAKPWYMNSCWSETKQLYPVLDEKGCDRFYYHGGSNHYVYGGYATTVNALEVANGVDLNVMMVGKSSMPEWEKIKWVYENVTKFASLSDVAQGNASGIILRVYARSVGGSWQEVGATVQYQLDSSSKSYPCMWFSVKGCKLKEVVSPSRRADEPWAYTDRLSFKITLVNTKPETGSDRSCFMRTWDSDSIDTDSCGQIELYAICPALPKFLRFEGIPKTLLQFALSSWNTQGQNDQNKPYLEAVTQRVFNNGFVYERIKGAYAFTSGAGRTFELDKFLQIWNVLNGTASESAKKAFERRGFKQQKPKVNCYDQTGILGLCVSFACKDEADRNTLIAYRMAPFGFLRASPLVGFSKGQNNEIVRCNNPFDTWTEQLLVDGQSRDRTSFGNHVFLMFRERIYDACAGPAIGATMSQYIKSSVDSAEGAYPTKVWDVDKNRKKIVVPVNKNDNGDWDAAKAYMPSDSHGGIMGQTENMLKNVAWNELPDDLDKKLDSSNFRLNISGLASWLQDKTASSSTCKVTNVSGPIIYTGAGDIGDRPNESGEFTWTISLNEEDATIHLRKFPDFNSAAADRFAMYGSGDVFDLPDEKTLATQQSVSGYMGGRAHATALIGANLIDCESADATTDNLSELLQFIIQSLKETSWSEIIVGNAKADGTRWDRYRRFAVTWGDMAYYYVQVSNCLDLDWSYETGAIFMQYYEILDRGQMTADELKLISQDANEPDMSKVYKFRFTVRASGGDTVKMVFYDRYYDPVVRYLDFRIRPRES